MSCSIEALQSKAKMYNMRQRQFQRQVLGPELTQPEPETIVESASHRMKAIVESALAKIRGTIGAQQPAPRDSGSVNSQGEEEKREDEESVSVSVDQANDKDFLEVVVTKKN